MSEDADVRLAKATLGAIQELSEATRLLMERVTRAEQAILAITADETMPRGARKAALLALRGEEGAGEAGLVISLLLGLIAIGLLAFAPEWVWITVAILGLVYAFALGLFMTGGNADRIAARALRERAQEREARARIYGGSGGWRL